MKILTNYRLHFHEVECTGGGNFNKVKRKGLSVNENLFQQMTYLILPLNRNKLNNNSVSKL